MKSVLVLYYSQSGQLGEILTNLVSPLYNDSNCSVTIHQIEPEEPYSFPWDKKEFLQVFPESYLQIPRPNKPIPDDIKNKKYDLIIFGYTVWYLSPSIPINSFLKGDDAKVLLNNTPLITVNGSRNMWVLTQEKIKRLLVDCKAELVGNIAFVDRHWNHVSVITIVHWMIGGKKTKYLGVFPKPGVSDKDINEAGKFGVIIKKHLFQKSFEHMQEELVNDGAVRIKPFLIRSDKSGNHIFSKWSAHIYKVGLKSPEKRVKWLNFFEYYLQFAIWVFVPIVFIIFLLTYLPFYARIKKDIKYYQSTRLR
ncbi:dialkylrecorsinol condensing enzyme DarA [Aquimarina sp. 2201CG14-23]|uniref:dialkylrecorsinol condensing enzyme DarA n=1 Tax=Aquimarina mycalae TaxID=3040073 RepID=UPI002477D37F|nr:dialkylrecorsinol condensing enzyme DarA [Aquimarina sp. 2201CG14-23]MDH7446749.1 dialkylresorcinol condensing enzyme DarA [Aquimarina sp. 2201CG14-23]